MNRPLAAYVLLAVYCSCVGWILSVFRILTPFNLAMAGAVGFIIAAQWSRQVQPNFKLRFPVHRWRRPLPALFLVVAILTLVSGFMFRESSGDSISYRIPRCLQWLHEQGWYWIPTYDNRQNNRGCAFEWMAVPILALLKTDRPLFLINYAAFLLFPSLIFQTFRLLGIRRRVAWAWMWIWPTGLCFVEQTASTLNDFLGGFFALAAICFGLLYRKSPGRTALYLSTLAFALATGVKALNILLIFPWVIAIYPGLRRDGLPPAWHFGLITTASAFSSFAPTALLNWLVTKDFLARAFEPDVFKPEMPFVLRGAISGVMMCVQNFYPPYIPGSDTLNAGIRHFLQTKVGFYLQSHFEAGLFWIPRDFNSLNEVGLGFFICLLATASLLYAITKRGVSWPWADSRFYIPFSALLSLLFFLCESDLSQIGRLAIPYYSLLLPLILYSPGAELAVRARWWINLGILQIVVTIFFILTSPLRPVLPVPSMIAAAENVVGPSYPLNVIQSVYLRAMTYYKRYDWISESLPAGVQRLGLIRLWYDMELPFWSPIGKRQVLTIDQAESAQTIRLHGFTYVAASSQAIQTLYGITADEWLKKYQGRVTAMYRSGGDTWMIIELSVYIPPATHLRTLPDGDD